MSSLQLPWSDTTSIGTGITRANHPSWTALTYLIHSLSVPLHTTGVMLQLLLCVSHIAIELLCIRGSGGMGKQPSVGIPSLFTRLRCLHSTFITYVSKCICVCMYLHINAWMYINNVYIITYVICTEITYSTQHALVMYILNTKSPPKCTNCIRLCGSAAMRPVLPRPHRVHRQLLRLLPRQGVDPGLVPLHLLHVLLLRPGLFHCGDRTTVWLYRDKMGSSGDHTFFVY